ncbi:MAG: leucyl aminopeptidase [candidate division Zixibacteria bacterium]|nr:leucyl aminopeptidase [candidate division Zixibacteria bacterium]
MQFRTTSGKLQEISADCIVLPVTSFSSVKSGALKQLDSASKGAVSSLASFGEFSGKTGEISSIYSPQGFKSKRVLLVGLGEESTLTADSFRAALGNVSRAKALTGSRKAVVYFDGFSDDEFFQAAIEGYMLGSFKMNEFRSGEARKDSSKLTDLLFAVSDKRELGPLQAAIKRGQIIAEGQNLARRLAFTPSNYLTPRIYARKMQELARKHRIHCRVLDEKAIERENMGCLLGVSRGSEEPPRFVILRYNGRRDGQKPVVLVGKGVTFDSGGISIKPAENMHEMKGDMHGSATMLATIITAARLKLPLNLVTITPLTENMPSGTATKPGDVLVSRKGITVEIINTDAEGRLILADALDYANTFEPQAVIDIATLTGAALFVLGYAGAPVLGNNDDLMAQLASASDATAERTWRMPIWDEFRDAMKGSISDLINSGGRPAGTMTATAFLENFIGNWPWAHIDIAYVDHEPKGRPYQPKGATGFGVRLLTHVLTNWHRPKK